MVVILHMTLLPDMTNNQAKFHYNPITNSKVKAQMEFDQTHPKGNTG